MPKAASAKNKGSLKSHFKSTKGPAAKASKSAPSKPAKEETSVVEISDEEESGPSDLDENSRKWNDLYTWALQRMEFDEPLHSTNKTKVDIILRVFDNCYEYGPCVGLTRLERFDRAQSLDMEPPKQIKDILSTHRAKSTPRIRECIFYNTDV